jgi:hypothetical protein
MHGLGRGDLRKDVQPLEGALLMANVIVWIAGAYHLGLILS